jgi:hypothetical protein
MSGFCSAHGEIDVSYADCVNRSECNAGVPYGLICICTQCKNSECPVTGRFRWSPTCVHAAKTHFIR